MATPLVPASKLVDLPIQPQREQEIEQLLADAKRTEELSQKQTLLESAFLKIKSTQSSERSIQLLFRTLHQYAKETCYNIEGPNDEELGMKETRHLMLWSLQAQRNESAKEILAHESLTALKHYAPAIDPLTHSETVLPTISNWSDEQKEELAQSICLLSYAAQNIDAYRRPENLAWHKTCYDLVIQIWDSKKEKGDFLEKKAEFRYNKDALLLELAGKSKQEQIACLTPVLEDFAQAWGKESEKYKGKVSQVLNRQAISEFRTKTEGWLARAQGYAREAVAIREAIRPSTNATENYEHFFLLANAREVLAKLLTEGEPTVQQLLEAKGYIQKSIAFADEWKAKGRNDSYFDYYKVGNLIDELLVKGQQPAK